MDKDRLKVGLKGHNNGLDRLQLCLNIFYERLKRLGNLIDPDPLIDLYRDLIGF